MTHALPSPPVPADADLRHFDDMPLAVARLRDSDIASIGDAEAFRCAVMLWCAAWHQVPAGSLPADDATLARMAGLGRDRRTWKRLRAAALRGFREFSDGRLYHRVVCEKVIGGLNSTRLHQWNKASGRVRKANMELRKRGLEELPAPESPEPLTLKWPVEGPSGNGVGNSSGTVPGRVTGTVPERGKSPEGNEMDLSERAPTGLSPEDHDETPRPVAARAAGLEGPHAHDADQAFEAYQKMAALQGWRPADPLTNDDRSRLEAVLKQVGLDGWRQGLHEATGAVLLRNSDGGMKRYFGIGWLLDEDHFEKLMEGAFGQTTATGARDTSGVIATASGSLRVVS